jgi:hypothetical protein
MPSRLLFGLLVLFGLAALWAVATPKYAAPDEPAQAVKAAATARGEWLGVRQFTPTVPNVRFEVPATIAEGTNPGCFAFTPTQPANCLDPWRSLDGLEPAVSYVGTYPPLYYAIVGLPSLLTAGTDVLFWMRLVSAALSAVFLAVAFVSASRLPRARAAMLGVAVAVTPLALFLAGVVNPSGLEISTALCLWTSGLALLTRRDERYGRSLLISTVVSAAVLVQLRGSSPLYVALIAAALLAVAGWRPVRELLRRRDAQIGLLVVAACAIFAVVWILRVGSLRLGAGGQPFIGDRVETLQAALSVGLAISEIIGVFGWLDAYLPTWCYYAWEAVCIALAVGTLLRRQWRLAAVAAVTAFLTVAIPTAVAYRKAATLGIVGQGRDIAPLAVGVPVLVGYACFRGLRSTRWVRGGVLVAAVVLGGVQVTGFVQALHRYRTGVNKPIWVLDAPWNPPIPWLLAVGLFAVLQVALIWWWRGLHPQPAAEAAVDHPTVAAVTAGDPLPRES